MKEIKAYIQPHRADAVAHALRGLEGLTGASISSVRGFGRSQGASDRHRVEDDLEMLAPHTKLEVICRDELVERVVSLILEHAHTGRRGDGKVYVSELQDAIRIATRERGEGAV